MAEQRAKPKWSEWVRWGCLAAAVAVLVVFLVAQRQSVDVSYGQSPSPSDPIKEGTAGELSGATVPSVDQMTALVRDAPVVRLPGAIATWDEQRVRGVIGGADVRILVAPPGLDKDERTRVRDVENATVRVIGTEVAGGIYQASGDSLDDWQAQFATGDVTNLLVTLIASLQKAPTPPDVDRFARRAPTAAELDPVVADLRATGVYLAKDATLKEVPAKAAASAFPDGGALYVALPPQPPGQPVPQYGDALAKVFPDRPIVVLYGSWIEYHGPNAEDFTEVVGASFYAQFADRLSQYAYPQGNVLYAYLNRVTDVRYAGLFDRPLPYVPFDPLRVALPALPWLFLGCAGVFLALSVRSLRKPSARFAGTGTSARLAGLTALAIEVSGLTSEKSDASLARGIVKLQAAREALDDTLPDSQVRTLLADAESDLEDAAKALGRNDYRPDVYLQGRLA
jgi:hypothetical protein